MPAGLRESLRVALSGVLACVLLAGVVASQAPRRLTIAYGSRSAAAWPLYIAKHGGYYAKHGLDVTLAFGIHPAPIAMVVSGAAAMAYHGIDPALIAGSKDGSLVALGSPINKGVFALVARPEIATPRDLKGRRIAVGRVGDVPYHHTVSLLGKFGLGGRDVQWIPTGLDVSARVAALASGRADASLLTSPGYFRLEDSGFRVLANLADFDDIYSSIVYLYRKRTVEADPALPEVLIRVHAEAIKRFYDDKAFAVEAYVAHDRQDTALVGRLYELYAKAGALERVPYVLAGAFRSAVDRADDISARQMRGFDFRAIVDNGPVHRLARDGFFERLFGPGVRAEQDRKAREAFGL